jgi:predicted RND superfamily exporter protein
MVLTLLSIFGMGRFAKSLKVENGPDATLAAHSAAHRALEEFRREFGDDSTFLLIVGGDVFSMDYLERLRNLHRELDKLDVPISAAPSSRLAAAASKAGTLDDFERESGMSNDQKGGGLFDQLTSLVNVRSTEWRDGSLHVGELLEEWPTPADLPALKARVLAEPTLVNRLISRDGRYSVIALRTGRMSEADSNKVYAAVDKISAKYVRPGFTIQSAGLPAFNAALGVMTTGDLGRLMMISQLVMIAVLAFLFRHPLGVLGPLLVVLNSVVFVVGAMAATSVPMTLIGTILPSFLIVAGIADSIHLLSEYRSLRLEGIPNDEAIVQTVVNTGTAIIFTSLTTFVGLVSLRYSELDAIRNMGTFGGVGTMVALFGSLTFLPAFLTLNRKSLLGARPELTGDSASLVDRVVQRLATISKPVELSGRISYRRTYAVTLAALGILLFAFLGIKRLTVRHDALDWFPAGNPLVAAYHVIDDKVGGSSDISLIVRTGHKDGLKSRKLLTGLEQLERDVRGYADPVTGEPIVGSSVSVLDPVRESWRAMHENASDKYAIPDSEAGVIDMLTVFESSAPEDLHQLASADLSTGLMQFRVRTIDSMRYIPLANRIEEGVKRFLGGQATVSITGAFFTSVTIINTLITDLVGSFGSSLLGIGVLLVLACRSLKVGIIAMIPNVIPILLVLGIMGWAGIPVNLANLLVAPIGMGIAVDDTVHYLHHFRARYDQDGNVDAAIDYALSRCGRALLSANLVLTLGFCVFVAGSMQNVQHFGLLTTLLIVLAVLCDLVLTPTCLRLFLRSSVTAPKALEVA